MPNVYVCMYQDFGFFKCLNNIYTYVVIALFEMESLS
jgi:hypothetical protein